MSPGLKYAAVTILCLFIPLLLIFPEDPDSPLIPVPLVISGSDPAPEDLQLEVNGKPRVVELLHRFNRDLKQKTDLARDFVLSFSLSEPDDHLRRGLSYFMTEVIVPTDTLSLVTPGKVFRINVSANRERMLSTVLEILKKECGKYRKMKRGFSKSIRNELSKIFNVLRDKEDSSSTFMVRRYTKLIGFLNSFPNEFNRLQRLAVVVDEEKYHTAVEEIRFRSGEKWWIHLHRREAGQVNARFDQVVREIEAFNIEHSDIFSKDLSPLMKRLKSLRYSTDFFPLDSMKEKMIRLGIGFFSVTYSSSSDKELSGPGSEKTVYDSIFESISRYTGGRSLYAVDPEDGIRKIKEGEYPVYLMGFRYNGILQEKKLSVKMGEKQGGSITFPGVIPMKELKGQLDHLAGDSCRIYGMEMKEGRIRFHITGYRFLRGQKAGLLKVRFIVESGSGALLHRKENVLHSPVKDLYLQIPFPMKNPGEYNVRILVIDLVDNHKIEESLAVTI